METVKNAHHIREHRLTVELVSQIFVPIESFSKAMEHARSVLHFHTCLLMEECAKLINVIPVKGRINMVNVMTVSLLRGPRISSKGMAVPVVLTSAVKSKN